MKSQFVFIEKIGIGYIIIPPNIDRESFVNHCLRRERVSILIENGGGVAHDCYISKSALKEIKFPLEFGEIGSAVLFYRDKHSNSVFVLEVFSKEDETDLKEEAVLVLKEIDGNNSASIIINGKNGNILLNTFSDTSGNGNLTINVTNNNKDALLKVITAGNISIESSDSVSITSKTSQSFITKNTQTRKQSEINIEEQIELKNELQSLKSLIDELLDGIGALTVPTPSGTSGVPLNIQTFIELKTKFAQLLK